MNRFDRIKDWKEFSSIMEKYIEVPQTKYGTNLKFNDLCHYTGLRIMLWNILKYALRLWSGAGKEHDFEKIAHYSQMAFILKEQQKRKPPFFKEDVEGDYVVPDKQNEQNNLSKVDLSKVEYKLEVFEDEKQKNSRAKLLKNKPLEGY